jgi:hypothetical protein
MLKKAAKLTSAWGLIAILVTRAVWAEDPPKMLSPKSLAPKTSPTQLNPSTQPSVTRPTYKQNPPNEENFSNFESYATSSFDSVSFSVLMGTPLMGETFSDKRFASFGDFFLFSIPLLKPSKNLFIHLETGPGFTFARLTFDAPPQKYSHLYLVAPVRFRFIRSFSKNFHIEAFAGIMLRPIEYDSRTTTDGGTHWIKGKELISADAGLGLDYNISPPLKIRILAGYLFLAGGLELTW